MLRVTSLLFPEKVPSRKEDVLGGRLAPAFFQVSYHFLPVHIHVLHSGTLSHLSVFHHMTHASHDLYTEDVGKIEARSICLDKSLIAFQFYFYIHSAYALIC